MALPYKTKFGKKTLTKFYVYGIRIGDNPIGGAARCEKRLFLLWKSKEWSKKTFFDPEMSLLAQNVFFFRSVECHKVRFHGH